MMWNTTALSIFLVLTSYFSLSTSDSFTCGILISIDGYRYDLTPLAAKGPQKINYISWNGNVSTILYSICGLLTQCGNCSLPGTCLLPNTCFGEFTLNNFHPLLYGAGIQFEYYGGDEGQANFERFTVFTIACSDTPGFSDVQVEDNSFQKLSIKMKSLSGCPAHGGYPPSFPFQYQYSKYIYHNYPGTGVVENNFVLDSTLGLLRRGNTLLDSSKGQTKLYNWGDYDQNHNLTCYYVLTDEQAVPFSLPDASKFMGTSNILVYDPTSAKFNEIEADQWEYNLDNCTSTLWFKSGMAIPVLQRSCNGAITVYFNFKLGQPDGSLFKSPPDCKPFQTCGADWDTCKYPFCCFEGTTCSICDK